MMCTCLYAYVKTHSVYSTRSELWSLGKIVACQCRFADRNKCDFWFGMLITGEVAGVCGHGTLCFLLNSAVNLKLIYKTKFISVTTF